jgi:hypothetical protein
LLWLGVFNGYATRHGQVLNQFFGDHENLPKLFTYLISWLLIVVFQVVSALLYVVYLALHPLYWLSVLAMGMLLYSSHALSVGPVWNTWLWCLSFSDKYRSEVAVDTAFLNRSLLARYLVHDAPLIIIVAMMRRGPYSDMDMANFIVQGANVLLMYRLIAQSYQDGCVSVSDCPFEIRMCGFDVGSRLGLLEAASRSRIEMRTHRSGESQAEVKSFFLDLLLEARISKESARLASLTAFRSSQFDQMYKYELDCVDASVLASFMDLLSKEKRDEFMTLMKPKSS